MKFIRTNISTVPQIVELIPGHLGDILLEIFTIIGHFPHQIIGNLKTDEKYMNTDNNYFSEDKNWQIYKKIKEFNYCNHKDAYNVFCNKIMNYFKRPFSQLDLACGDASYMVNILSKTLLRSYVGVDLSEYALKDARKNFTQLNCKTSIECSDYMQYLVNCQTKFDLITCFLSVHHLLLPQKKVFFKRCRETLKENGLLVIYEPLLLEGESREEFLPRFGDIVSKRVVLTEEERKLSFAHISESDFPESKSTFEKISKQAGFKKVETIYKNDNSGYFAGLMCFTR